MILLFEITVTIKTKITQHIFNRAGKFEFSKIKISKLSCLESRLGGKIWSFEIVSSFACLRVAASAKAGISCFGFRPV
jgi:hypothetical protein